MKRPNKGVEVTLSATRRITVYTHIYIHICKAGMFVLERDAIEPLRVRTAVIFRPLPRPQARVFDACTLVKDPAGLTGTLRTGMCSKCHRS